MPVMTGLINVLSYLSVSNVADKVNPLFKLSLLFASAAWIAATVAAVVYSAYGFAAGNFTTVLPLKFLRATARLTVVLFVPLTSFLVSTRIRNNARGAESPRVRNHALEHARVLVHRVCVALADRITCNTAFACADHN